MSVITRACLDPKSRLLCEVAGDGMCEWQTPAVGSRRSADTSLPRYPQIVISTRDVDLKKRILSGISSNEPYFQTLVGLTKCVTLGPKDLCLNSPNSIKTSELRKLELH
ncbi:hypothetical protein RRG08_014621 [Elysia crispata]|uniref:Uncharacterized protein n=1 Tax=Elysia crispata TaxID=231223 RepID=A0AAE0YRR9_9GAST|nr:hypothetical protein RRG08_014621 [Elysia crispata]